MELKPSERRILCNQYRILEALYPQEADEFRKAREELEQGGSAFIEADESLLGEAERSLVRRILSLFDALQHSHRVLEDPPGIDDPDQLLFPGFDAEAESAFAAYARLLLAETGQFAHVDHKEGTDRDRPSLPAFQRMLDAWGVYSDARDLTIVQIYYILEAAAEPTHD